MEKLMDQLSLLALCASLLIQLTNFTTPVVLILIMLTLTMFSLYFSEKKWLFGIFCTYFIFCLIEPTFLFFLPLCFYECYQQKFWWGFTLVLLYFYGTSYFTNIGLLFWIGVSVLSVSLSHKTEQLLQARARLITFRDTSAELQNTMKNRNKELMEKQDYEIHLATLRERNRIAREIHDNVGHMLSRSILQLGALATIHKEEPLQSQLKSVNDSLNQAMNSIRESVHDLHDDSIDLKQSILEATREIEKNYELHLEYDMSSSAPRKVKYCFITTVKEAMSNIVKHSNADKIVIILREHPGFYQMSIEDNGTMQREKKKQILTEGSSGIGLTNMQERVDALHGTLHINREQGFKIFISIPKTEEQLCES